MTTVTAILNKYLIADIFLLSKYQTVAICLLLLCQRTVHGDDDSIGYETYEVTYANYFETTYLEPITSSTINDVQTTETVPFYSNLLEVGFVHAFIASLSVILVSELGDKTFFIAAIMAMQHSRLIVFAGGKLGD